MPFSWLEEKFKRFCFSSASQGGARTNRLNCNFIGWMWLRPPHSPAPCLPYKAQDKINPTYKRS